MRWPLYRVHVHLSMRIDGMSYLPESACPRWSVKVKVWNQYHAALPRHAATNLRQDSTWLSQIQSSETVSRLTVRVMMRPFNIWRTEADSTVAQSRSQEEYRVVLLWRNLDSNCEPRDDRGGPQSRWHKFKQLVQITAAFKYLVSGLRAQPNPLQKPAWCSALSALCPACQSLAQTGPALIR